MSNNLRFVRLALCAALLTAPARAFAATETFDADPAWEGFRNRLKPEKPQIVRQSFGYRTTQHAKGQKPGEIGGWVQRSIVPAYYGKPITAKGLSDKISFSSRFSVRRDAGNSGVLLGLFNDEQSRGWRTPHSLALRLDGNGDRYWVFFEYGTGTWHTGCKGCFQGDAYQTTTTRPFPADGTPHDFTLTYDPAARNNDGLITFVLDATTYELPLDSSHKAEGATFNRFGIWNQQTAGGGMELYVDDLTLDGERVGFDVDPKWDAKGNEAEFENRVIRPLHDFGFSATRHAGGRGTVGGEIGGLIWRDERPAYYGAKVGPLTLKDPLSASGKLAFTGAGSDSAVYFGWFDSKTKQQSAGPEHKQPQRNILGVLLEGPSRVGHYFRPAYRGTDGEGSTDDTGPIVRPDGRPHEWSVQYDPAGAAGNGAITIKFDDVARTLNLRPGDKAKATTFDRFGFINCQSGGHYVYVYVDDLSFTAAPASK